MIGSWFRSKQREELKQLKIRAEVYFDSEISAIKKITKKDIEILHDGCDLGEYLPSDVYRDGLCCFKHNHHPDLNKHPYTYNHLSGEKHYFAKDDCIATLNNGGEALYWQAINSACGAKICRGFIL